MVQLATDAHPDACSSGDKGCGEETTNGARHDDIRVVAEPMPGNPSWERHLRTEAVALPCGGDASTVLANGAGQSAGQQLAAFPRTRAPDIKHADDRRATTVSAIRSSVTTATVGLIGLFEISNDFGR